MRLELVILEQLMLGAPTDIVARDKLHRFPTNGAKRALYSAISVPLPRGRRG
jgi:hypothetical protein